MENCLRVLFLKESSSNLPMTFDTCLLLTPDIWLFLKQTSRMKVQKALTRHVPFRLTLFSNGSLHLGDPLASDSFLNGLHVLSRKCLFQFLLSRRTYLHKRYGLDLPYFYQTDFNLVLGKASLYLFHRGKTMYCDFFFFLTLGAYQCSSEQGIFYRIQSPPSSLIAYKVRFLNA